MYPGGLFDGNYRTNVTFPSREYWFGLYKKKARSRRKDAYWYDGNNSTYMDWIIGEPNQKTKCVRYTKSGFRDQDCNEKYYYTCKKAASKFNAEYSQF